jgi:hypothetical protein
MWDIDFVAAAVRTLVLEPHASVAGPLPVVGMDFVVDFVVRMVAGYCLDFA